MKRLIATGLSLAFAVSVLAATADAQLSKEGGLFCTRSCGVKEGFRMLWARHAFWTSMYITSATAGLDDANIIAEKLLRNQVDIGNVIMSLYGNPANGRLTELLSDHILIAARLVSAEKAGDRATSAEAGQRWHANADKIAAFLSGVNPNWPEAGLKSLLHSYLDLTKREITARLEKNYADEIAIRDRKYDEILKLADILADGFVRKLPGNSETNRIKVIRSGKKFEEGT
jgi:hypothetical protein